MANEIEKPVQFLFNEKTFRHSLRSAETFSEEQILSAVRRELNFEKLHQAIQIARKKLENNKLEE